MDLDDREASSRWVKLLYYGWKVFTCLFLHLMLIGIVIGYCFLGAYMFETLERQYEIDMKRNITKIRNEIGEDIWNFTKYEIPLLEEANWTESVAKKLKKFETQLIWAMRKGGWDGNETEVSLQWTRGGALFYSIIVITTIGYGHIAPKTAEGKIATIFYAIIGIPLMLLCLSNIGDIMAQSFRFLYWRVFCYKCTQPRRPPPPMQLRRTRSYRGASTRSHGGRFSGRSRMSYKQPSGGGRNSQRSADSALGSLEAGYAKSSYSDTECCYGDEIEREAQMLGTPSHKFNRISQQSRYSDNVTMYSSPPSNSRKMPIDMESGREYTCRNSPVFYNRYALEEEEDCVRYNGRRNNNLDKENSRMMYKKRRNQRVLENPQPEYSPRVGREKPHTQPQAIRPVKESMGPCPRIMSPLGLAVHRQTFPRAPRVEYYPEENYDFLYDYYDEYNQPDYTRPVPIWLCVFLVVSYILGGAVLFSEQEKQWGFFNAAYFCFITLTTIGFGDYVPQPKSDKNAEIGVAICSIYLLFGIALLAMSFNLVQEEVINNVKSVARHLGIIKSENGED